MITAICRLEDIVYVRWTENGKHVDSQVDFDGKYVRGFKMPLPERDIKFRIWFQATNPTWSEYKARKEFDKLFPLATA